MEKEIQTQSPVVSGRTANRTTGRVQVAQERSSPKSEEKHYGVCMNSKQHRDPLSHAGKADVFIKE